MHFRLNPYLSFDGTARAAMEFYRDVLGGELAVNTYGEFGDPSAPGADRIMHARLDTTAGFTLMAGDTPTGMAQAAVQGISVSLSGDNADELREYWRRLCAGATITMPLEKQIWGDEFGMCTDRFGVPWMVNIADCADVA
jgi:PhnB protein